MGCTHPTAVAFAPSGRALAAAGHDEVVRVWALQRAFAHDDKRVVRMGADAFVAAVAEAARGDALLKRGRDWEALIQFSRSKQLLVVVQQTDHYAPRHLYN